MNPIDKALQRVKREDFLPDDIKNQANIDSALPIGFGQTNSQPTTVRLMLEWLEPQPGDRILDVGSGSGWTTALLSQLVDKKGKVYAVERIPELVDFGRNNVERLGIKNASFHRAGSKYGLPKYAPYDKILVSASADHLPKELIEQLKVDGKLVIPVNYDILEITKTDKVNFDINKHPGFVFVPLV